METHILENIIKSQLLTGRLSRLWVCCAADGDMGAGSLPFQVQGGVMAWMPSHHCYYQLWSRSTSAAFAQHGATAIKPWGQ